MNRHSLGFVNSRHWQAAGLLASAAIVFAAYSVAPGPEHRTVAQEPIQRQAAPCASCQQAPTGQCTTCQGRLAPYASAYAHPLPPLVGQRHVDAPIAGVPEEGIHRFNPYLCGVDDQGGPCSPEANWENRGPIAWQSVFAQGEYIGPARTQHVPVYRFRVDDSLTFTFRINREVEPEYKLNVNDQVRIESAVDAELDRTITIAPDGTIMLPYVHSVMAANRTVSELREELERRYKEYYVEPSMTVTPVRMGSRLEDLSNAVDGRFSDSGGLGVIRVVMPDGTVSLPAIGQVPVQGLTLEEIRQEVNERYRSIVHGLDVTPDLRAKAPTYAYVLGEVAAPQRIVLDRPTTALMAIAQAGGENIGGNTRQIVIFRRTHDWRLIATKIDLQGAIWGQKPAPSDDVYLRDADIVLVPKRPIQIADDFINLIFTQGIYGIFPNQGFSISSTF